MPLPRPSPPARDAASWRLRERTRPMRPTSQALQRACAAARRAATATRALENLAQADRGQSQEIPVQGLPHASRPLTLPHHPQNAGVLPIRTRQTMKLFALAALCTVLPVPVLVDALPVVQLENVQQYFPRTPSRRQPTPPQTSTPPPMRPPRSPAELTHLPATSSTTTGACRSTAKSK